MTPLDKSLKRSIKINQHDYVVTLSPEALKITQKGHRVGLELKWSELVSGESALAIALRASVGQFDIGRPAARNAPAHKSGTTTKAKTRNKPMHRSLPKRPR
jgi:hypothetical protein